jgi:hypothetical protein
MEYFYIIWSVELQPEQTNFRQMVGEQGLEP